MYGNRQRIRKTGFKSDHDRLIRYSVQHSNPTAVMASNKKGKMRYDKLKNNRRAIAIHFLATHI